MENQIEQYRAYLFSQKYPKVTVKNYVSDLSSFIRWYEEKYGKQFIPQVLSIESVSKYAQDPKASSKTRKRHLASLRKFYQFQKEIHGLTHNPFTLSPQKNNGNVDRWLIKEFTYYLQNKKVSKLTIKNYIADIKQFTLWIERVCSLQQEALTHLQSLKKETIDEYKSRLIKEKQFAPASINRKLSSIRKYLEWLYENNHIHQPESLLLQNVSIRSDKAPKDNQIDSFLPLNEDAVDPITENIQVLYPKKRHWFAPYRLTMTLFGAGSSLLDALFILPVVGLIEKSQMILFVLSGKTIFKSLANTEKVSRFIPAKDIDLDRFILEGNSEKEIQVRPTLPKIKNLKKSFYAPLSIKTDNLALHKKVYLHLRYTRPEWYRRYHQYRIVHYIHFGILLAYISFFIYSFFFLHLEKEIKQGTAFAALPTSPPKILSFKGRLTDTSNLPITAPSMLRFSLYKSSISSGSALLWQDVLDVSPNENGNFIASLGTRTPLSQSLLDENPNLYIGIAVGSGAELKPRQQLATGGFAQDTETVQGLAPITSTHDHKNVLLALDSAGNLAIGGNTGPTFQATDGQFTITGENVLFTTNIGSNSSVILSPDGLGVVDIQKPIVNSIDDPNSSVPGAVLVNDSLGIIATSSAIAALSIEKQSSGLLINASGSGATRFTLDDTGNAVFSGRLSVNGNSITSTQTTFSLLPDSVINLSIGGSATELTLGATIGTTTIRNTSQLFGNIQLGDSITDSISISARLATHLTPAETSKYDLGSSSLAFNNAYVTNLFMTPNASTSGFLRRENGNISFVNQADNLLLGSTNPSSALIKLAAAAGEDSFINSGKFAIGTTGSLTDRLHVYGDIRIGTSGTDGCLKRFDGTALAGTCSSDMRLKKDIKPIEDILDKVTQLRPTTFTMRSDEFPEYGFGTGTSYGLIAQEVEQIFPQLVHTDSRGYKAVSYGPELSMLTLAGLKELYARVKQLEENNNLPSREINDRGDIALELTENKKYVVKENGSIIKNVQIFSETLAAKISVGLLNAKEGFFDTLSLATDQFTINGVRLRDYIVSLIENSPINNTASIATPRLLASDVQVNIISPLSEDSEIALEFKEQQISIKTNKNGTEKVVASFDTNGNATFSGTLSANQLSISENLSAHDATVSGTLRAGRIIAGDIDGLDLSAEALAKVDDKLATLAAALNNNQSATNSPIPYNTQTDVNLQPTTYNLQPITDNSQPGSTSADSIIQSDNSQPTTNNQQPTTYNLATDYVASVSSSLAYIPNFQTDLSTVTNGLMVFGSTSLAEVSVANQLSVGGNLVLADNTINVLGASLELQPLRQGSLFIMGGLVTIDIDGNLSVNGNAVFAKNVSIEGTLATNIIAPVPGEDLVITLGTNEPKETNGTKEENTFSTSGSSVSSGSLRVKNALGDSVLTVNSFGDLIASGTATLSSLQIVRGAQADTSVIETTASGSAGISSITAGYTTRTIYSPYVKEDSLIYITPRSETSQAVPYLSRQTPEDSANEIPGSFTVQIPLETSEDILFNWWIVN